MANQYGHLSAMDSHHDVDHVWESIVQEETYFGHTWPSHVVTVFRHAWSSEVDHAWAR